MGIPYQRRCDQKSRVRSADILVSDAGVVQVKGVSGHALQVRGDGMGQEIMSWLRGWGWGYVLRIRGFVIRRRSLEIWIYSRNIVVNCWREFIFCFRNWRTRGWCSVLVKWVLLGVWKW